LTSLGCAHWLYGKTLISGRAVSRHPTAAVRYRNAGGPQTTPSPSRVNDCARSLAAAALKRATPLILTVSGRFPQAIILQSRLTPGGHRETSTWSSCRRCRNHIGGGFGVGSGLTAQSGCAGIPRAGAGRSTRHAKSPAFNGAFALSDRRITLAVAVTPANARDNHVLEFLRWKKQHSAAR
jgi:hypothetical protein